MADNFNFKQFLYENKLGAYSKIRPLHEADVEVRPGSEGRADKEVVLTTEDGTSYNLSIHAIDEDTIKIKSGTDEEGRALKAAELYQLELEYEADIASAIYGKYGKDIEISRAMKGMPTDLEEAIQYSTIEKVEKVIDNRLMQTALDAIADLLMDLESKKDSEGEKITHEEALAYLQMKMKEYLGDWEIKS